MPVALWLPNAAFFVAGLIFLCRLERPGDRDVFGALLTANSQASMKASRRAGWAANASDWPRWRLPLLPQFVDTYILSNFLFYLLLMLASFVSLAQIYNFFELLGDMLRNNIRC